MMPTVVKEQAPVPPPSYQRAQAKQGSALHMNALSAAFVKCDNKTVWPLEPTYAVLCGVFVSSVFHERSTSATVPVKRFKPKTETKPQTEARPARYAPTGPLYTSVGNGWTLSTTARSAQAIHARTSQCELPTACLPPPGDDRRLDGPSVASAAARADVSAPSARQ